MGHVYILLLLARAWPWGHVRMLLGLTGVSRGHPMLTMRDSPRVSRGHPMLTMGDSPGVLHLSLTGAARTHGSGTRAWTWTHWTLSRSHTWHSSSHGHSDIIH